jgi:hypothetical protein
VGVYDLFSPMTRRVMLLWAFRAPLHSTILEKRNKTTVNYGVFLSKVSLDELELVEAMKSEESVQLQYQNFSSWLTDFKQHFNIEIKMEKLTQNKKNYTI